MAATEQMKVKIDADVASGINGIKQVNAELNRMPAAAGKAGAAIGKTTKDFTGLSRVIQDLPFGFTAISNNLTQLIPAAGAAGLAFSAIVAGLTFAQTGLANWTRGLGDSKKGIDENSDALIIMSRQIEDAKDRMDAFAQTLEFVNKISKLRLDINFGKGLTTDLLDLQGISVGNRELGVRLRETRDIILDHRNKLQAQFDASLDSKQFDKMIAGTLSDDDLNENQKKIKASLDQRNEDFKKADTELIKNRQGQSIIHAQIEQQKIDITEDAAKKQEEASKKANAKLKKLLEEEAKIRFEHLQSLTRNFVGKDFSIPIFFNIALAKLQAQNNPSETIGQLLTKELLPKTIPLRINVAPKPQVADKELVKLMTDLESEISKTLQGVGTQAFTTIGDAIAAGITGGNIGDAFESLFAFIGGAIQDLGKQMIALSPIIAALKVAIKTLNPALLLPAGIGLVAIGGVLKNLKPKGFATGGVIPAGFPNDSFWARLTSGERVLTPAQNKEWERGAMGRANISFPEYLPAVSISANQLDLFYKRSNRFVTNTH